MELARWEREAAKPINWGERTYWSLKNREREPNLNDTNAITSNSSVNSITQTIQSKATVRKALEDNPVISGPLDGTNILRELSEDEQCLFFSQYSKSNCLILSNWFNISLNVLRCISITCGESLREIDLSNSLVEGRHLEVLLVRTGNLQTLRLNNCSKVDAKCFMVLVPLVNQSLQELFLHRCLSVSNEVVQWIGGKGSLAGIALSKLHTLDLSECSAVDDRGLVQIARGCKRLKFLNLENVYTVTDKSMVEICSNCKKIQLLNVNGCFALTNKSAITIGKNLTSLMTINLSRCSLITDKGIKSIALGCKHLQAINLSGLVKISEESMFCLVDSCKGLLTMNVTGCERITTNGLDNLVMGLAFVEKATSFFGFKPIDRYLENLLDSKLKMMLTRDSIDYEEQIKKRIAEERQMKEAHVTLITKSATLIQQYLFRYKKRMYFYHLWQLRLKKLAAGYIQRVYRGYLGRMRAAIERENHLAFLAKSPQACQLQRHIRAYLSRLKNRAVSQKIRELYIIRRREVESALAVRIQCHARSFLAKRYVISYRELQHRYRQNVFDSVLILQMLVRRFLSKMELGRRRVKKRNLEEARRTAGLKIKKFSVEGMKRYKAQLSGEALKRFFRHKWTASIVIQRVFRGYRGRYCCQKMRIVRAARHYAAREIQRIFRGSRVLYYKDLRLNVVAAFVLDRHYVERRERVEAARLRYRQYILMNQQDSASEPDTEEDEVHPWIKQYDAKKKLPYWQNFATNEITYDEPLIPLAHEKAMIGKRVKIFWIVQAAWYEGTITKYHLRKKRHRIEYDDGDHEWINLELEGERVQVLAEDSTWILYLMYQSEEKQNEIRKLEEKSQRDEYKNKAFRDATQWKSFMDDYNNEVMFLSSITGEIRAGQPNALEWVVQDDGFGFPVFYNTITHQMVYEDPRFKHDIDEDTLQQRKYVLQEMRYLLYLCKQLWEEYEQIILLPDQKQHYKIMMKIRNSQQVQQLSAFIIRAKALFEPTSIVDKPLDKALVEEFDYASWIVARLSEVVERTELMLIDRRDNKKSLISKLSAKNDEIVYCRFCKRETKKHLSYCPTCGKQQIFY